MFLRIGYQDMRLPKKESFQGRPEILRFTLFQILYTVSQCLKITEKVSFNIASEASYVHILCGQKFIKNAKNGQFGEFLKTRSLRSNSVTRQVSLYRTKIDEKCQNSINQMRHFEQFSNNVKT